jgi:3-oxoadipate enol-lactonase
VTGAPVTLAHETHGTEHAGVAVLLHSLGLDRRVWDPLIAPLGRHRRLVVVDLRGHGKSPVNTGASIEDMADDVAATLAQLGHRRVSVIGMSMGGCVAQALAVRHPERVDALGLIDTTAWYGPAAATAWGQRAERALADGLRSLSEFQLTRWFSEAFRAANPDVCAELLEVFASNDLGSYAASCRAMGAVDLRDGVQRIDVPTTIVVGELDEATPPEHAEDLHSRIRGSTLHVVPGSKHLTPYERPADVADCLEPILR